MSSDDHSDEWPAVWLAENEKLLRELGLWDEAASGKVVVRNRHLSGLQFDSIWLGDSVFEGVTMEDCYFTSEAPWISLSRGSAAHSSFRKSDLGKGTIENFEFIDCQFQRTDFWQATIRSVQFRNCTLPKTRFVNVELVDVLFAGCTLDRTFFDGATLSGVQFENSKIVGPVFTKGAVVLDDPVRTVEDLIGLDPAAGLGG